MHFVFCALKFFQVGLGFALKRLSFATFAKCCEASVAERVDIGYNGFAISISWMNTFPDLACRYVLLIVCLCAPSV